MTWEDEVRERIVRDRMAEVRDRMAEANHKLRDLRDEIELLKTKIFSKQKLRRIKYAIEACRRMEAMSGGPRDFTSESIDDDILAVIEKALA